MPALEYTLREFMRQKNLNAKQLAEGIGVQPSSISHILTGRNEAGLDFLRKLIKKFPEADLHYLLTGEGSPLRSARSESEKAPDRYDEGGETTGKPGEDKGSASGPELILLLFPDGTFRDYKQAL